MLNSQSTHTSSQSPLEIKLKDLENIFFSETSLEEKTAFFYRKTQELTIENNGFQSQIERFKADLAIAAEKIKNLLRIIFGPRSERDKDNDPKSEDKNNDPKSEDKNNDPKPEEKEDKEKTNNGGGRRKLPENLPRKKVKKTLDREELEKKGYKIIRVLSSVTSETLEHVPMELYVLEEEKERLEVEDPDGNIVILTAEGAPQVLQKVQATNSVFAGICVYKFGYALPTNRISQMFLENLWAITRGAMCRWLIQIAALFKPLMDVLEERLKASKYISIDETTIQVLREPGKSPESKSYMWIRMTKGTPHAIVLFFYSPNRLGETARMLLKGATGYVQTDGYSGYDKAVEESFRLGCAMHARRNFFDAKKAAPKGMTDTLAQYALGLFKKLYKIEEEIKDLSPEERFIIRNEKATPIWEHFLEWASEKILRTQPKSKIHEALNYFINQYSRLTGYLKDGILEIDNGAIERMIRPFAIGRKNWLFADTVEGAKSNAVFYSLVSMMRVNHLPIYATFLKLLNLLSCPNPNYEKMADLIMDRPSEESSIH